MIDRIFSGEHPGLAYLGAALILAATGSASLMQGFSEQRSVAHTQPRGPVFTAADQPAVKEQQATAGTLEAEDISEFLGYAQPTSIDIPAASISSPLVSVGKTEAGSIDTPKQPDFDKAAWYHNSPTPGQYGVSVIVGHVDSFESGNAASVFYNLPKLQPGDTVNVVRADNTTAVFTVYAIREYGRDAIPADQVYQTHTDGAELRLITCSGNFDSATGEYTDNTVVYATMADSHPSSLLAIITCIL